MPASPSTPDLAQLNAATRAALLSLARQAILSHWSPSLRLDSSAIEPALAQAPLACFVTLHHGTELRGWSMTLHTKTEKLSLSASGEGEGFIVFGNCLTH